MTKWVPYFHFGHQQHTFLSVRSGMLPGSVELQQADGPEGARGNFLWECMGSLSQDLTKMGFRQGSNQTLLFVGIS